jgi:hypothetical protein
MTPDQIDRRDFLKHASATIAVGAVFTPTMMVAIPRSDGHRARR